MENEFLDKVEDNAAIQTWSEAIQWEKCDSLAKGYISELWDFTRISVTQNSLQELKEIWDQWNKEVDKHLFRALAQFWNPAYSCFTFGGGTNLQWMNTWLCFVARRFKQIEFTRELLMSQIS
ncbi:hypothetical protein Gogos_022391 [Gossypium gossypioides]|uniref:Uncharacterized protein n=1 Tax=Gossypium gossypioides TaxID=34282 RepID=A0A7J9D130_GOSGO|nr:hypothetical protein [Gossypium gossypioides]